MTERKLRQPTSDNGYPVNSGATQAGTRGREPANSSSTNGRFPANVPSNAGRVPVQGIRGREPTNAPGHGGAVMPNRGRPMPTGVPAGNRNTKKQVCEHYFH